MPNAGYYEGDPDQRIEDVSDVVYEALQPYAESHSGDVPADRVSWASAVLHAAGRSIGVSAEEIDQGINYGLETLRDASDVVQRGTVNGRGYAEERPL